MTRTGLTERGSSNRGRCRARRSKRAFAALGASLVISVAAGCASQQQPSQPADPGPPQPVIETVPFQEILTSVPVRASFPSRLGISHVMLYYRPYGERAWSSRELARSGQTWAGEISCYDVSTIAGYMQLFLQASDAGGRVIVATGSAAWPYVVSIVNRLASGPAWLPGASMPWRCIDPADCPSDFPGCPHRAPLRPPCASNGDCGEGEYCAWDGYCDAVNPVLAGPVVAPPPGYAQ